MCAVAGSGRARGGSGATRRACRSSGEGNKAGLRELAGDGGGFETTSQHETGRVAGQVAGEHGEGWASLLMTTWNKRRFVLVYVPSSSGRGRRRSRNWGTWANLNPRNLAAVAAAAATRLRAGAGKAGGSDETKGRRGGPNPEKKYLAPSDAVLATSRAVNNVPNRQ